MKFAQTFLYLLAACAAAKSACAADSAYEQKIYERCLEIAAGHQPEISVTYNYGQLKYDTGKTETEIEALYKKINPGEKAKSGKWLGLTSLQPQTSAAVTPEADVIDDKYACFYPGKVEIKIWYEPVVYISSSLKPGSCRFNTTVRHEQTHLDIGHHALYLFAKSVKRNINSIIDMRSSARIALIQNADGDKIIKEMTDQSFARLKNHFDIFKDNLIKYNRIIDTDQNYKDETALCPSD